MRGLRKINSASYKSRQLLDKDSTATTKKTAGQYRHLAPSHLFFLLKRIFISLITTLFLYWLPIEPTSKEHLLSQMEDTLNAKMVGGADEYKNAPNKKDGMGTEGVPSKSPSGHVNRGTPAEKEIRYDVPVRGPTHHILMCAHCRDALRARCTKHVADAICDWFQAPGYKRRRKRTTVKYINSWILEQCAFIDNHLALLQPRVLDELLAVALKSFLESDFTEARFLLAKAMLLALLRRLDINQVRRMLAVANPFSDLILKLDSDKTLAEHLELALDAFGGQQCETIAVRWSDANARYSLQTYEGSVQTAPAQFNNPYESDVACASAPASKILSDEQDQALDGLNDQRNAPEGQIGAEALPTSLDDQITQQNEEARALRKSRRQHHVSSLIPETVAEPAVHANDVKPNSMRAMKKERKRNKQQAQARRREMMRQKEEATKFLKETAFARETASENITILQYEPQHGSSVSLLTKGYRKTLRRADKASSSEAFEIATVMWQHQLKYPDV